MDYKVVVTRDAEEDLECFIKYLFIEKESMQAAEIRHTDFHRMIVHTIMQEKEQIPPMWQQEKPWIPLG